MFVLFSQCVLSPLGRITTIPRRCPPLCLHLFAMPDFRALSSQRQRETIQPKDIWTVSKVYKKEGSLLCNCTHGPTKVDVTEVAVTNAVASSFGLWLSVLRGVVKPLMLAQLRDRFPRYLWSSLPQLAKALRTFLASATPDAELLFCSSIAEHMLWEPAESEFRDTVEHDHAAFKLIFSHQKPLSSKPDFKTAAGWLCLCTPYTARGLSTNHWNACGMVLLTLLASLRIPPVIWPS